MATKTEKQKKLEELDELVLDRMLAIMGSTTAGALGDLSDLSVAMNYLRNNQVTAEKPKSTVEDDTKKRLKEAERRRNEQLDDDL